METDIHPHIQSPSVEIEPEPKSPLERARERLSVTPIGEMIADAKKRKRSWLVNGVIAEGTAGVLGAAAKSGKTWAAVDLAVAVAGKGKWLNKHQVQKSGPVLFYPGECGGDPLTQRIDAVCRYYRLDPDTLPISCSKYIPALMNPIDITVVREEIEKTKPVLVILDSIYLAVGGVNLADIASVGSALYPLQQICDRNGAALMLTHHWNSTGSGTSAERMSGAGWTAWGRYLISMNGTVESASEEMTRVKLDFILTGGEVPETRWAITRTVYREDPDDIDTPLHYELGDATYTKTKAKTIRGTARVLKHATDSGGRIKAEDLYTLDQEYAKKEGIDVLSKDTLDKYVRKLIAENTLERTVDKDGSIVLTVVNLHTSSSSSQNSRDASAANASISPDFPGGE